MPKASKDKKSIKEQVDELNECIDWFYGEDFSLDEAVDKYKAAKKLADNIEKDLNELKNQIALLEDFTKN